MSLSPPSPMIWGDFFSKEPNPRLKITRIYRLRIHTTPRRD